MSSLSFLDLRHPKDNVTTSLAYWLALTRAYRIDDAAREQFEGAMSYQYDVEEQTECTGWANLLSSDLRWQRRLRPVAPVQVADRWSPCPMATALLGEPCALSVGPESISRCVVMIWNRRQLGRLERRSCSVNTQDERRCAELLRETCELARVYRCGVLLVASPGWSYDHAPPMPPWIAESMIRRGYLRTDRRS